MSINIYYDGANLQTIRSLIETHSIQGITTNPTLMKKEGISKYELYAQEILSVAYDLPVSLEVFADSPYEILRQARVIAGWGRSVYVKVPIIRTDGSSNHELVRILSYEGINLNVTAILTLDQVDTVIHTLSPDTSAIISIFAGRIADTGRNPVPVISEAVIMCRSCQKVQILWASTREVYNIIQATECGCHIITVPLDILMKVPKIGMDLDAVTLETVSTFYRDAEESGLSC